jgi:hypothetical protein
MAAICANFASGAQDQRPVSSRRVPKTQLTGLGFAGLLADLAEKYGVTIGVEFFRGNKSESVHTMTMDMQEGTLGSLIDKIIATDGRYRWKEIDGVIQVYPKGTREELLDVVVQYFSVEGNFLEARVGDEICNLPEVKSRMDSLGITAFNPLPYSMITGMDYRRHFSVKVQTVTLRELLNEIARNTDDHFWSIGRWPPENKIIPLSF